MILSRNLLASLLVGSLALPAALAQPGRGKHTTHSKVTTKTRHTRYVARDVTDSTTSGDSTTADESATASSSTTTDTTVISVTTTMTSSDAGQTYTVTDSGPITDAGSSYTATEATNTDVVAATITPTDASYDASTSTAAPDTTTTADAGASTTETSAESTSTSSSSSSSAPSSTPTQKVCGASSPQVLNSWTTTGGAAAVANGKSKPYGFAGATGRRFLQLVSTPKHHSSSASQRLRGLAGDTATLTFDWAYAVFPVPVPEGKGKNKKIAVAVPSDVSCTLRVSLGPSSHKAGGAATAVKSWTRPANAGASSGRTTVTLSAVSAKRAGELKFAFVCSEPKYDAGVMIANVKLRSC